MPTTATPNILTDAGYLFWAPFGTTIPTNTVVGSVFTDAWPVGWISLGATEDGSTLSYESTVEPIQVAEFLDPIKYATTSRQGSIAFNLADWTLSNYKRALNGGTLSLVTGSGTTALNRFRPPTPGAETRAAIGWESLDASVRLVAYQTLNGGTIESAFRKAPDKALIPCQFNFEVPASGIPFEIYTAGTARA